MSENSSDTVFSLEQMRKRDAVRYGQDDWMVRDKSSYRVSEDYQEIQWTLVNTRKEIYYLLVARQGKMPATRDTWILTHQISLDSIQYEPESGTVKSFTEENFPKTAPKSIRYQSIQFDFDGENSGKAKDDDGRRVNKITWDYYDVSRKRNLAIEIWKESDRDYPEAYDGVVVLPSEFQPHPRHVANQLHREHFHWEDLRKLSKIFWILLLVIFGIPFDCCVAAIVPVLLASIFLIRRSKFWIMISAVVWAAIFAILVLLRGDGGYWTITLGSILAATFIPRWVVASMPQAKEEEFHFIAFTGLLPALWAYSFWLYFRYAPGPHDFRQICVAVVLPLVATALCYGLNRFMDRLYESTQT